MAKNVSGRSTTNRKRRSTVGLPKGKTSGNVFMTQKEAIAAATKLAGGNGRILSRSTATGRAVHISRLPSGQWVVVEQRGAQERHGAAKHTPTHRSSYGALKHLGPAPSAEDIDQVRQEMWANFAKD